MPTSPPDHPTTIRAAILGVVLAIGTASCQALPPPARADAREGVVRAGSPEEARGIATALDALLPAVLSELPDSRTRRLEIWVQDEPALYRFPLTSAYRDADGFFSDRLARIHLRAGADDVERTLVHELVHASLGRSWRTLPGTIEEGLCDVVAARLCPRSAARLRSGRLLAAALAVGGLDLEVRCAPGGGARDPGSEVRFVQRVLPTPDRSFALDPLEVFRAHAGLSTSAMSGERKKALYGLAFVVAQRIVDRRGVAGLHDLASYRGNPERAAEAFLAAAGLSRKPEDWRRAIAEALGPAEIAELSRMQPESLAPDAADPRSRSATASIRLVTSLATSTGLP